MTTIIEDLKAVLAAIDATGTPKEKNAALSAAVVVLIENYKTRQTATLDVCGTLATVAPDSVQKYRNLEGFKPAQSFETQVLAGLTPAMKTMVIAAAEPTEPTAAEPTEPTAAEPTEPTAAEPTAAEPTEPTAGKQLKK